jgi:hypothetical protein
MTGMIFLITLQLKIYLLQFFFFFQFLAFIVFFFFYFLIMQHFSPAVTVIFILGYYMNEQNQLTNPIREYNTVKSLYYVHTRDPKISLYLLPYT